MSPTNQTHKITTIADLMRLVTLDNVDALAADIKGLLVNVAATKALMKVIDPENQEDIFEGESIDWKDDGMNEQRLIAECGEGKQIVFATKGLENKGKHKRPAKSNA